MRVEMSLSAPIRKKKRQIGAQEEETKPDAMFKRRNKAGEEVTGALMAPQMSERRPGPAAAN